MYHHVRNFRSDRARITVWTPWGAVTTIRSRKDVPVEPARRLREVEARLRWLEAARAPAVRNRA